MTSPQLVFVSYISRSGSTFLCKLLDEYAKVGVAIEGGFPGFPHHTMPPNISSLESDADLDHYLDLLFSDVRFSEWKVDRQQLRARLVGIGYPIHFDKILNLCLTDYFEDEFSHWVYKAGFYIECMDEVRGLFRSAKHVYIQRDPRAIFNSQKNSKSLYHDRPMGHDVVAFAVTYKVRSALALRYQNDDDFLCLKYEDILCDPSRALALITSFIGLKCTDKLTLGSYAEKIPINQQSLHANIDSSPLLSNTSKWRGKLSVVEIQFLQRALRDELEAFNYKAISCDIMEVKDYFQYIKLLSHYYASSWWRGLKKLRS